MTLVSQLDLLAAYDLEIRPVVYAHPIPSTASRMSTPIHLVASNILLIRLPLEPAIVLRAKQGVLITSLVQRRLRLDRSPDRFAPNSVSGVW